MLNDAIDRIEEIEDPVDVIIIPPNDGDNSVMMIEETQTTFRLRFSPPPQKLWCQTLSKKRRMHPAQRKKEKGYFDGTHAKNKWKLQWHTKKFPIFPMHG